MTTTPLFPKLDCAKCKTLTAHRCLGGYRRTAGIMSFECAICFSTRQGSALPTPDALGQEVDSMRAKLISARAEIERLRSCDDSRVRDDRGDLYRRCLVAWGPDAQLEMVVEECAELIVAMQHLMRGRKSGVRSVVEELADVTIVVEQARAIIGAGVVDRVIGEKLARLRARVQAHEDEATRVGAILAESVSGGGT